MVWDQGPRITWSLGFFKDDGQAIEEGLAVLVISEYFAAFNSPGHHMLQKAGKRLGVVGGAWCKVIVLLRKSSIDFFAVKKPCNGGRAAKLHYLTTSHIHSCLSTSFVPFSAPRATVTVKSGTGIDILI